MAAQMHPLERHRKAAGLSRLDFAKRLGVTTQTVWNWENGNMIPNAKLYPKIAKVLKVTPLEVTEMVSPSMPASAS